MVRREHLRDQAQNTLSGTRVTVLSFSWGNYFKEDDIHLKLSYVYESPIALCSLLLVYDRDLENTFEVMNVPLIDWLYTLNCSQNQIFFWFYLSWVLAASWLTY